MQKNNIVSLILFFVFCTCSFAAEAVNQGSQWELKSRFFVYQLNSGDGLRAKSWSNLLSGTSIALSGSEIEIDTGDDLQKPSTTPLAVVESEIHGPGLLSFLLQDPKKTLSVHVRYQWDDEKPFLHKFTTITNRSDLPIRVLNVRAGTYITDAELHDKIQIVPTGAFGNISRTGDKEQGFPLYLNDDFVMSLAHPAGWNTNLNGIASLRQYPGVLLSPQESFECMEAVYGVAAKGDAKTNFINHIRERCRRVVRQHDKPYIIFDNFASWKNDDFGNNREKYVLHSLSKLAESQETFGQIFDLCNIHFWVDYAGDLKLWDRERFPNGYEKIRPVLENLGIKPGLWTDSSMISWTIGQNPDTHPSLTHDKGYFCRASEPIKSMYREAFIQHLRDEKVRLLKFDNLHALVCNNPEHDHLPGIYSTEAIENSIIEFLNDLDKECPELFIMLYWGHRSPWWLLHGDTLFDSGGGIIEAATPTQYPSAYIRDSVTQMLDQCQKRSDDVLWLGKDSLGVWLSSWRWNSSIGKEHWQEGVVMDICRGSLLLQIWSDIDSFTPLEWKQLADFAALLKSQPNCFVNPRFILGNPYNPEPYGYSCSDGNRAFLAISNYSWNDNFISLELGEKWGLPDNRQWDLYRWYPEPAKLTADSDHFMTGVSLLFKPFEIALFEVVPAGEKPSLDRSFSEERIVTEFTENSGELNLSVIDTLQLDFENEQKAEKNNWVNLSPTSLNTKNGSILTKESDNSIFASGENPSLETYTVKTQNKIDGVTAFRFELLTDSRLPSGGPGRVYNGNIALSDFKVSILDGEKEIPVVLKKSSASFSQQSYGGFPIENAIDGNSETAWSIHPLHGKNVVAIFETEQPVSVPENAALVFVLTQGYSSDKEAHNIGRFRLSATVDKTVFSIPVKRERQFIVNTESPKTDQGGILVITTELSQNSNPIEFDNIGSRFIATAEMDGQPTECQPIIGLWTFEGCWQGWRFEIAPHSSPKKIKLEMTPAFSEDTDFSFKSHFIPNK